jgi:low affinity Fe/Cu permease
VPEIYNEKRIDMKEFFRKFSQKTSEVVGSPGAFIFALLLLVIWAFFGPVFHFSDTWQLVINTATTIITFLIVVLIQNTQNRDAKELHLKLDELIRSIRGARNSMVNLEELSDDELETLQKQFRRIGEHYARVSYHDAESTEIANPDEDSEMEKREEGNENTSA